MNPIQDMKRIDFDYPSDTMEDLLFHLARYKFIGRQLRKDWEVLEIGCGTGYGSNFLSKFAKYINACELDLSLLVRAREKFIQPNLEYTDVPTREQYEAVVCLEVIEHMTKDYGYKLLDTVDKHLKQHGIAFISTPRKIDNPSENRKKYHLHEYSAAEYTAMLEERFTRVLLFAQNDEIISSQNPENAWNFMAVCFKG